MQKGRVNSNPCILIVEYVTMFLFITILLLLITFVFRIIILNSSKPSHKVYLVDYACFKPKKSQQRPREDSVRIMKSFCSSNNIKERDEYIYKVTMGSGIGDFTYGPETLLQDPPDLSLNGARTEAEAAMYAVVDAVLAKTRVRAEDIGMLLVNYTCPFNLIPSLSEMIVNRYKLRDDVKSFEVTGMGCTAGLIAIDLAHRLLQVNENSYVLVVSTELLTPNLYRGNDTSKLAINIVMRTGAAAIVLSNRPHDQNSSKYELVHTVRTNTTSSDKSYKCIIREEDSEGITGVTVNKDLVVEARRAIESHLKTLGRLILPKSEQLCFGLNRLMRKLPMARNHMKEYRPSFSRATDHFLPHVGAVMVINELEKILKLDVEAPRMTLYRFGNTSCTSVWYELAYTEAKGKVKGGDRVWQMAFGSGFKCSSVVWRAVKRVDGAEVGNPWSDEIDEFPVVTTEREKQLLDAFYEHPK